MKTYTLTFNEQEMQILNAALVELPFRAVAQLIASINKQLEEQRNEVATEK